jgi:hypothetical protein
VTRRPADLAVAAVIAVFGGFALTAVAARTLAFTTLAVPVAWRQALSAPLQFGNELMIFCFVVLSAELAVPLLFAVLFLARRSLCVRRAAAGRLELLPFWHLVAWPLVALNQFFLDFAWPVGLACWAGVALTALAARLRPPLAAHAAAWAALALLGGLASHSRADLAALVVFAAVSFPIARATPRRLRPRDAALLLVAAVALSQATAASADILGIVVIIAAAAAAVVVLGRRHSARRRWGAAAATLFAGLVLAGPLQRRLFDHGGRSLGAGLAYSFCELPALNRVYAAIPNCVFGGEGCAAGELAWYDLAHLPNGERHRVFTSGDFNGRLEQPLCVDDRTLVVGMCCTAGQGQDNEAAITVDPTAPAAYRRHADGVDVARRVVLDRAHDALFYVGNHVLRIDRRTGAASTAVGDQLSRYPARGTAGIGGLFISDPDCFHRARNSLFIADFLRGSRVYEIDLDSLEIRRAFDAHNGGTIGMAVDEELGRLYLAGAMGVSVFDIETGAFVLARRTGALARHPVIDRERGLVYVPTTMGGRIHVFDRRTFERRGTLPIGLETRNALLTSDGRWFFASARDRHFYWDAASLAARFSD